MPRSQLRKVERAYGKRLASEQLEWVNGGDYGRLVSWMEDEMEISLPSSVRNWVRRNC